MHPFPPILYPNGPKPMHLSKQKNTAASTSSRASTPERGKPSPAQPFHPSPNAAFSTESIRRRWRRRSRLRCACSTAASAASRPSTASSAPTSSDASPGSACTHPGSTPTSSSPRPPPVRAPPPSFSPSPVSPQPNLICVFIWSAAQVAATARTSTRSGSASSAPGSRTAPPAPQVRVAPRPRLVLNSCCCFFSSWKWH
jgi:hypothetical protein